MSEATRRAAVDRLNNRQSGKTAKVIAKEFDVYPGSIFNWWRQPLKKKAAELKQQPKSNLKVK